MSAHKTILDRVAYSFLEWLGDVGGFIEGISLLLAGILILFQFQPLGTFMVKRLY